MKNRSSCTDSGLKGSGLYYAVHSLKGGILKQIVIDSEVEKKHVAENHLIVKPGDEDSFVHWCKLYVGHSGDEI